MIGLEGNLITFFLYIPRRIWMNLYKVLHLGENPYSCFMKIHHVFQCRVILLNTLENEWKNYQIVQIFRIQFFNFEKSGKLLKCLCILEPDIPSIFMTIFFIHEWLLKCLSVCFECRKNTTELLKIPRLNIFRSEKFCKLPKRRCNSKSDIPFIIMAIFISDEWLLKCLSPWFWLRL